LLSMTAQCWFCNRFMLLSDDAYLWWTPYGGVIDMEPPDDEYAHVKCWNDAPLAQKKLIQRTAWRSNDTIRGV
jgi:hypothetical protein